MIRAHFSEVETYMICTKILKNIFASKLVLCNRYGCKYIVLFNRCLYVIKKT